MLSITKCRRFVEWGHGKNYNLAQQVGGVHQGDLGHAGHPSIHPPPHPHPLSGPGSRSE